ncbi:MAG: acetyl-CoA acetyltransferase [Pirellulaceae bacterium]|nr:MAG: acetyl-CoA acetyltransferase [Pirellulaceae bacterium]
MGHAVILGTARSPIGSLNGSLADVPVPELAGQVIRAACDRSRVPPDQLDDVILGNVVSAGLGQNPARQAALTAGIPPSVGALTINKVCGSGLKAVILAAQAIRLDEARCVLAGGFESMSRAPYLLLQARQGYRFGHRELLDAVLYDGLTDAYEQQPMGHYGERCAERFGIGRKEQDDYAVRSYRRALEAQTHGWFENEIVPIRITTRKETKTIDQDEEPQRFNEEKLRALPPVFAAEGTITAGNASKLNDGAAAVLVADQQWATAHGLKPQARIVGAAGYAQEPEWFTTAPIGAVRRLLERVGWTIDDVDLFEINEAFSVVAIVAQRELKLPDEKLNVWGGAVALGHPIGCSGARILVTLLSAMRQKGARRGVAALCLGGGEAVALAVERYE